MSARTSSSRSGWATPSRCPPPDAIAQRFFAEHERAYGFHNPADPIEIVNFRLIGGRQAAPARGAARRAAQDAAQAEPASRPQGLVRGRCRAGHAGLRPRRRCCPAIRIAGPAVIEQLDATTLLFPGDRATVDPHLNLIVRHRRMTSIDPITLEIISNGLQVDRRRDLHRADEERLLDQHQGAARPLDRDHRSAPGG